jgi:hypothetical protein
MRGFAHYSSTHISFTSLFGHTYCSKETISHKVKNKNTNPNLRCNNRRNGDKIDTHTLLFTFLTGFKQNQDGYQMVIQLLCLVHKQ